MLGTGLVLFTVGAIGFVRERRRLSTMVLMLAGLASGGMATLVLLADSGVMGAVPLVIIVALLLACFLGYPILALFLIGNGITMLRRESRSLGNVLSLLTGLVMLIWPIVMTWLASLTDPESTTGIVLAGLNVLTTGVGFYLGLCFLVFLCAAVAYRRLPGRFEVEHVIVLGSGLIGSRVPPLLARRLDTAIEVANRQDPPAILIPSGGQGADEEVAEGVAMADYLVAAGVPRDRIIVEDRAVSTRENLLFSRALMPDPDAPVAVVTTRYHVFRTALLTRDLGMRAKVAGAPTAAYFIPSAFLREFVAIMREHLWLNATLIGGWTVIIGALYATLLAVG